MYDKCNMRIKRREWTSSSFGKVEAEQPIPLNSLLLSIPKGVEEDKQKLEI